MSSISTFSARTFPQRTAEVPTVHRAIVAMDIATQI
jgi:hypothetical protein